MKHRLDHILVQKQLVPTRSQAESYIRLGQVKVDGKVIAKPGYFVHEESNITFGAKTQYVSRAALKLASVAATLHLTFKGKTVLDVGSSTGGFTDYALQHGASKVIAVDVGTNQLHEKLRADSRVELHEKTDIRNVRFHSEPVEKARQINERSLDSTRDDKRVYLTELSDIAVIDVSFISMTKVLPHVATLLKKDGLIVAMCKPQFEAGKNQLNKGVVKNSKQRREILQQFENWVKQHHFVVIKKSDSAIAGEKGNVERFYLLRTSK